MASSEIRLENIGFEALEKIILKDVNLALEQGESFVLIGPSGLGKSVLLKLIAGLLSPSRGAIYINEKDLLKTRGTERENLIRQMGMLFQKNALFDSLSVSENLAFPMRELTALSEKQISESVHHYLDAVGILHAKDLFPDEISGGMQKRLGIARALVLKPKILLFDDPTAGLDPITSRKIVDLILQVRKENGTSMISITNDMHRAFQLADRIGMVIDHTLLITGSVTQTKSHADPRVQQFIQGKLDGPIFGVQA